MQTPGIEINKVFRLVRDEVLTATNNSQEPFVYGTLPAQDFYFCEPVNVGSASGSTSVMS